MSYPLSSVSLALVVSALLLPVSAQAVAPKSPSEPKSVPAPVPRGAHDVQCLLLTSQLAASENKELARQGMIAAGYFMGKVFGTRPDIDLLAAMKAEIPMLKGDRARQVLGSCGQEMIQRGKQVAETGKALAAEEAKQAK